MNITRSGDSIPQEMYETLRGKESKKDQYLTNARGTSGKKTESCLCFRPTPGCFLADVDVVACTAACGLDAWLSFLWNAVGTVKQNTFPQNLDILLHSAVLCKQNS